MKILTKIPIPLLGAFALILASVYHVAIQTETDTLIIDARKLEPGETMRISLDYIPHKMKFYFIKEEFYYITFHASNTTMLFTVPEGKTVSHVIIYETYRQLIQPLTETTEIKITPMKVPPYKPRLEITIYRVPVPP